MTRPIDRYALNFAKVAYHEDHLDSLDDTDIKEIWRIFHTFKSKDHAAIAEYPLWINQEKNWTPRDRRRVKQYQREGRNCMFMFSHNRIVKYLDHLKELGQPYS